MTIQCWMDFGLKENQLYISKDKDSSMRMFLRKYCLRPSCYECHAKYYKTSDLTIADFWGIEYVAPEMNDGKGTSMKIEKKYAVDIKISLLRRIVGKLKFLLKRFLMRGMLITQRSNADYGELFTFRK